MLDHTSYVPILRRRSAEIGALTNLLNEDFSHVIPFIELCEQILSLEKRKKLLEVNNNVYFWEVIKSLAGCCGNKPYFIDFVNVEGLFSLQQGKHPLETYFELLNHNFLKAIPVTGLNRPEIAQSAVENTVKRFSLNLCIRLGQGDIREPSLVPRLILLLKRFALEPKDVDLLVDLKEFRLSSPSIEEICDRVPMLSEWRNFIVASGAFPENLSDYAKNDEHELLRNDWNHWKIGMNAKENIERIPTYSDYTVQFPQPPKPLAFAPNISASIRYASPDHWVVMRGEGLRNKDGAQYDQYWGQANLLMSRPEYSGPNFSYGDQYISRIGSQTEETGNPTTWLQAAINRHMTLTMRQILHASSSKTSSKEDFRSLSEPPLPRVWNKRRLVLPDGHSQGYLFNPYE